MQFKRPWLLIPLLLALAQLNACTTTEEVAVEETLSADTGTDPDAVNFDAPPAEAEGNTPADDPSSSDFSDPNEVGLTSEMTPTDGASASAEAASQQPIDTAEGAILADETAIAMDNAAPVESTVVNVTFAKNSTKVKKKFRLPLKEIAQKLKADPQMNVHLAGHTDARGSSKFNKKLAMKRAKAVKAALVKMGVKRKQIITESFGKEHLLAVGNSETEHAQNRRVEATVK